MVRVVGAILSLEGRKEGRSEEEQRRSRKACCWGAMGSADVGGSSGEFGC